MVINPTFELSMTLDADRFQRILSWVCDEKYGLQKLNDEYLDTSFIEKGITVIYRNSRYKKKVRLLIDTGLTMENVANTDKLIRKLERRIALYFDHKYGLDDFTLSGVNLVLDLNVGTRTNVSDYLKILRRVGKVKGFSPVSYDGFDEKASFCLSGNSNGIDFLLYDMEKAVLNHLESSDADWRELRSVSGQTKGVIQVQVRLTKPKAVRAYTDSADVSGQMLELVESRTDIFMDIFTRVVPFGDFYKMNAAVEIVRSEVKDSIMRRKMLRLLALIPEKKSLHLAQKAMNCRDVDKVMEAFAKINLAPVTISKRHDVKHLENVYSYILK